MKKGVILLVAVQLVLAVSLQAAEMREAQLQQLSQLLKKGPAPNVRLSETQKKKAEQLLKLVLPDKNHIGEKKEWKVIYHDTDQGDFFQADLKKKGDTSFDKFMWFHILYKQETPKFYGSEDFWGYRGMGMKDVHYFILAGNLEIRAVAVSDEYKNDKAIKDMLRAFKLKDIENL